MREHIVRCSGTFISLLLARFPLAIGEARELSDHIAFVAIHQLTAFSHVMHKSNPQQEAGPFDPSSAPAAQTDVPLFSETRSGYQCSRDDSDGTLTQVSFVHAHPILMGKWVLSEQQEQHTCQTSASDSCATQVTLRLCQALVQATLSNLASGKQAMKQ